MNWGMFVAFPCLTCSDRATSRSVSLSSLLADSHGQFGAPTKVSDTRLMSNDGKMETSFISFKAAHPELNTKDPTGLLYLSRTAGLSARRTADDHTPSGITVVGAITDREWEYEQALHKSQTAGVRRRCGAIGRSLGFSRDVNDTQTIDGNDVSV